VGYASIHCREGILFEVFSFPRIRVPSPKSPSSSQLLADFGIRSGEIYLHCLEISYFDSDLLGNSSPPVQRKGIVVVVLMAVVVVVVV
jgi:hypothetical protein